MLIAAFSLNPNTYGNVLYVVKEGVAFDHGKLGSKRLGFAELDDPDMESRIPKGDGFISLPYAQYVKDATTNIVDRVSDSMVLIDTSVVDAKTLETMQDQTQISPVLTADVAPSTVQVQLFTDPKLQPVPIVTAIDLGDYTAAAAADAQPAPLPSPLPPISAGK